jgi:hypothetical protein
VTTTNDGFRWLFEEASRRMEAEKEERCPARCENHGVDWSYGFDLDADGSCPECVR